MSTILVVDDDPTILRLVSEVLQGENHATLAAPDGASAAEISSRHAGNIDLLLSDIVMPEMSGLQLAAELAEKRSEMQVLLMSGFNHEDLVLDKGWHFIAKPFRPKALLETVRRILRIAAR